ncbi:MAG: excinuclease ABC subunit C [Methanosarcinaceae archaeon]|nr:excinuclease ABC subunit C [Methanosarcinaceae archaeon]
MTIDIENIPTNPGCYLYKDSNGEIIYVGKAKNLKKRVSSYFQKTNHDAKTRVLVKSIYSADFIITDNEVEALILENSLIKKHKPKYNIDLRDSKNYAYIHISDDDFPRISIMRRATKKGKLYGPFVSAKERDYVLELVQKTFKLRPCRNLPKRPCLRYHIDTCSAPCIKNITEEEYQISVKNAEEALKGNVDDLIKNLEKDMKKASTELNFEKALTLREQISSLKHLKEHQSMDRRITHNEDVINYIVKRNRVYIMVFNVISGTLLGKEEFSFPYSLNFLEEFLVQYYSEHPTPAEIILPDAFEILDEDAYLDEEENNNLKNNYTEDMINQSLIDFLSDRRGSKVKITIPKRGDKKRLIDLALKNIETVFFGSIKKVEELKKKLMLDKMPEVIECFDISHLSGSWTVASMVRFKDGKPDKSNYRRYRIRTVEGIDDYSAIAEVVERRYKRLIEEKSDMPDLILIDGGKGQLAYANDVLKKLELKIPVISIAEREEEIYVPGLDDPLPIAKNEKASLYLQEIRDEAHRFALSYNRLLREKALREEAEKYKKTQKAKAKVLSKAKANEKK